MIISGSGNALLNEILGSLTDPEAQGVGSLNAHLRWLANSTPERRYVLDDCEALTNWAVLSNDTDNLELSTNHIWGTKSIEFDKVDGAGDTVYAGIVKTIASGDYGDFSVQDLFQLRFYVSDLSEIVRLRLRLGTDESNHLEWYVDNTDLKVGWNYIQVILGLPTNVTGTGLNIDNVDYLAIIIEFDTEDDTLTDMAVDLITFHSVNHVLARPEVGASSIGSRLIKKAFVRKIQPVSVGYTVSGSGSPSPNGDYVDAGYDNEGEDVYTFTDGSSNVWSIWYHANGWNFWIMNYLSAVDVIPPVGGYFQATNGGAELIITGTYAGGGGYSGTPTVGAGPPGYKKLVADGDEWEDIPFSGIIYCPSTNTDGVTFLIDGNTVTLPKGTSFPVSQILLNEIQVVTTAGDYVLVYGGNW